MLQFSKAMRLSDLSSLGHGRTSCHHISPSCFCVRMPDVSPCFSYDSLELPNCFIHAGFPFDQHQGFTRPQQSHSIHAEHPVALELVVQRDCPATSVHEQGGAANDTENEILLETSPSSCRNRI